MAKEGEGAQRVFILRNEDSKEHRILQRGLQLSLSANESFAHGGSALRELYFRAANTRSDGLTR